MAGRPRASERGSARERMLDMAERLIAEHGIDGVSLRQIGAATGQGNNSAVQYYFGDKAGLVREIIARRVAAFEPRRRAMMEAAKADGRQPDIRTLLEIIYMPLAEVTDEEGRHIYVRFMSQFLTRLQYHPGFDHPGWAPDSAGIEAAYLLGERIGFIDYERFTTRINRVGGLFFNALVDRDNAIAHGRKVEPESVFYDDLFGMMSIAVQAPPPPA